MGRSRLAYRAKHKGTLSENSRKQISAAHKEKQQERTLPQEVDVPAQVEPSESDQEEYLEGMNILDEPKLYIRANEFSDFLTGVGVNIDDKKSICVSTLEFS